MVLSTKQMVASLAVAFLALPSPSQASDSLVIATYNTHLVPDALRCAEQVDIGFLIASGAAAMVDGTLVVLATGLPQAAQLADCMLRQEDISYQEAGLVSAEILKRNFDVIALNEVFDEDARERLLNDLATAYPFTIEYINSGPDLEDSGLMLFSKFPLGNLANPNAVFRDGTVHGSTDQVGFVKYDECSYFDCLSSKGAAFVKILNTRPGASIPAWDLVFTHMQAAYDSDDEYRDDRKAQFDQIQDLVRNATLGGEATPLFIVGDLNVEGENGQWDIATATATAGGDEWKGFAATANGDPMVTDSWAATTSPLDIGITNHLGKLGDMRLDYILNSGSGAERAPCIQHLTRAYLGNSDHIAVIANTNRHEDFCSPREAWDRPPLDTYLRNPVAGSADRTRIARPGAIQWYFVELPESATGAALGTTSPFDPLTGAGVRIELFSPSDLTTPIAPTTRETFTFGEVQTQKYALPRTFYVRVFSPTPSWTGDYDLFIHELTCASAEEACPIRANDPHRYDMLFNPGVALGSDDTAWFEIAVTDRADSGREQTLRVFADEFNGNLLNAKLRAQSNGDPLDLNGQAVRTRLGSAEITGTALGPLTFYLTLRRTDLSQGTRVRVGWESNLTRLGGVSIGVPGARSANLVCDDETDGVLGSEAGKDEISLLVRVDMTPFREIVYHEFDCNQGPVPLFIDGELGTIRFLDEVVFTLYERDDGTIINPDDESQWNIQKPLPAGPFLAPGQPDTGILRSTDFARWDFEGGKYHLEYNLSRQGFR